MPWQALPTRCQFVLGNFHAIHMKNRRAPKNMIHMNGKYIVMMKTLLFVLWEWCVCVCTFECVCVRSGLWAD